MLMVWIMLVIVVVGLLWALSRTKGSQRWMDRGLINLVVVMLGQMFSKLMKEGLGVVWLLFGRGKSEEDENHLSRAREICKMMVPKGKIQEIVNAMNKAGAFEKKAQAMIFNGPVTKAFTYMKAAG